MDEAVQNDGEMIDEYWTWIFYGYHSDDLSYGSARLIIVSCDECCLYRVLEMRNYRDLCRSCAKKGERNPFFGMFHTNEHKHAVSESNRIRDVTNEIRLNMSKARKGKKLPPFTDDHKLKISISTTGKTVTDITRRRSSATRQGISYDEWEKFAKDGEYCHKFDEACRERNRDKYDRLCFVCSMDEEENGQKLSVHHVDMNKNQGCDDHEWELVPLCRSHHSLSHHEPLHSRIRWLLKNVWML